MKIRISTLLLTIEIFLHFGELNASENEEVSSSMKNKKRKLKEAQVKSVIEGRPHETIKYLDSTLHVTDIDLWLDEKRKKVLRADFRNNYVPAAGYFRNNVFFVRLILVGEWRVVGYFRTSWKLFGVRAPAKHADSRIMEPTPEKWFIVYCRARFVVTDDTETGNVKSISLFPQNLHEIAENRNRVTPEKVTLGGVSFIVYRGPDEKILGAELDREIHRISEPHAD